MSSCAGLVGLTEEELIQRLGPPLARREAGGETWLVFRSPEMNLRVRLGGNGSHVVRSWTASFESGHRSLSEAARAVGLWPAAAPDEEAAGVYLPLVRRPLPCPDSGRVHSMTATVREGRFIAVSVFDEPPDWL